MSLAEQVARAILGQRAAPDRGGHCECRAAWRRETSPAAPAVGKAWLQLRELAFEFAPAHTAVRHEARELEEMLERELGAVLRSAEGRERY